MHLLTQPWLSIATALAVVFLFEPIASAQKPATPSNITNSVGVVSGSLAIPKIYRNSAYYVIGGIFPLTSSSGAAQDKGIQRAEAFRCAVDYYNSDLSFLPNVSVFYQVMDDQDTSTTALYKALNLIQSQVTSIIGPSSSSVSQAVASFAASFNVPIISYASTSPLLSNSVLYPTFLRTVPSDAAQAQAMVSVCVRFGWKLISAIGTDDAYGSGGLSAFRLYADQAGLSVLCGNTIATDLPSQFSEAANCVASSPANVVLLFMNANNAGYMLKNISDLSSKYNGVDPLGRMTFIASDSWAASSITSTLKSLNVATSSISGSIGVAPTDGDLTLIKSCFKTRNPSNTNYTAFLSWWQSTFSCSLNTSLGLSACPAYGNGTRSNCTCDGSEDMGSITINNKAAYVFDAVYTILSAISYLTQPTKCQNLRKLYNFTDSLCSSTTYTGSEILQVAKVLQLSGLTGSIQFNKTDRNTANYEILQYTSSNTWLKVGTFDAALTLSFNESLLGWKSGTVAPTSAIEPDFTHVTDPLAIVVFLFSGIGMALSIYSFFWIYLHRTRPVIKRSSPLFLILMLAGVAIIFLSTLLWIGEMNSALCVSRVWLGIIGFGVVMGNMLAKTYRIWRIFNNKKLRSRIITDRELLLFSGIVVLPSIVILVFWTAYDPPSPTVVTYSQTYSYVSCAGTNQTVQTAVTAALLGYNGLLIFGGAWLAYVTRKVQSSFNESKWIGFAMYDLFFGLAILVPVYFTSGDGSGSVQRKFIIRSLAMIFCNFFTIIVLFLPKFKAVNKDESTQDPTRSGNLSDTPKSAPLRTNQQAAAARRNNGTVDESAAYVLGPFGKRIQSPQVTGQDSADDARASEGVEYEPETKTAPQPTYSDQTKQQQRASPMLSRIKKVVRAASGLGKEFEYSEDPEKKPLSRQGSNVFAQQGRAQNQMNEEDEDENMEHFTYNDDER